MEPRQKDVPEGRAEIQEQLEPLTKVVELSWRDKKFPAKLERERQNCLKENPEQ